MLPSGPCADCADELKYDLHVLLVRHGKQCPACAKAGSARQLAAAASGSSSACPLADLKAPKGKLKTASPAGGKQRAPLNAGGSKKAEAEATEQTTAAVAAAAAGRPAGEAPGKPGSGKRRKVQAG